MSFDILPPLSDIKQKPFAFDQGLIDRIALALSAYLGFVLYPAYGVLRYVWVGETSAFSASGIATVTLTSVLFGLFARRTMRRYLHVTPASD